MDVDGITEWYVNFLVTFSQHIHDVRPIISGIPPGGNFDYVVPINSSGQWGTYWLHAHSFAVSFESKVQVPFQFFLNLTVLTKVNTLMDYVPQSKFIHPRRYIPTMENSP
jgi:hypothetical protein